MISDILKTVKLLTQIVYKMAHFVNQLAQFYFYKTRILGIIDCYGSHQVYVRYDKFDFTLMWHAQQVLGYQLLSARSLWNVIMVLTKPTWKE